MNNATPQPVPYLPWLVLLFRILSKVRREGLMSIEEETEEPAKGESLFTQHPETLAQPYLDFATDLLRMMVGGNLDPALLKVYAEQAIRRHGEAGQAAIPLLECIWLTLWASLNGLPPQVAVEYGRQAIPIAEKPGFLELETILRKSRNDPTQTEERDLAAEIDEFVDTLEG